MTDTESPLVAFECAMPGNRYSDRGALLALGQKPDGTIVHIDDVLSGLNCGCTCPACNGALVAHKGPKVLHHFHHRDANACKTAGETALHLFAKQFLDERRILLLPPLIAEVGNIAHKFGAEREFVFDGADLEVPMPGMVPDVILRHGSHELLVEIYVTHRCGEEKIRRLRERGISAIEIDLSKLRGNASRAELEEAILRTAPREWLSNRKIEKKRAEITAEIDLNKKLRRQKAEREFQALLAAHEAAKKAPVRSDAKSAEAVAKVTAAGYGRAIGIPIPGDYWFNVDRRQWQAVVFELFVLKALERHDFYPWDAFRWNTVLRRCEERGILRDDLPLPTHANWDRLTNSAEGYRTPDQVVSRYMEELAAQRIVESRHDDGWAVVETERQRHKDWRRRIKEREQRESGPSSAMMGCGPTPDFEVSIAPAGSRRKLRCGTSAVAAGSRIRKKMTIIDLYPLRRMQLHSKARFLPTTSGSPQSPRMRSRYVSYPDGSVQTP